MGSGCLVVVKERNGCPTHALASRGDSREVPPERLLTAQDLADYLEVPVKTIYTWRHRNAGPRGFRIGRHLRFQWRDVQAWLRDRIAEDC